MSNVLAAARLIAAAIVWRERHDPHRAAHLIRELEDELQHVWREQPPDGSYRTREHTCALGWQVPEHG